MRVRRIRNAAADMLPAGRLGLLLLAVALGGHSAAVGDSIRLQGPTMGTYYAVTVDTDDSAAEPLLKTAVEDYLSEFNRLFSNWDPTSEISRFNNHDGTDWFPADPSVVRCLTEARRIHELTLGRFDPTVSPLIELWGFGAAGRREIPSASEIADAADLIGMSKIEVRTEPPAIRRTVPGVQLNLSAIAKGMAVDGVADLLRSHGFSSFIVDIGGENYAGAAKQGGGDWRIGVESPLATDPLVITLTEQGIATSGDYRNNFHAAGRRYAHVIDPGTGRPAEDPVSSVSVIADTTMTADAWATALMILGEQAGGEIARREGLSVLFQRVHPDGTFSVTPIGDFVAPVERQQGAAGPGKESMSVRSETTPETSVPGDEPSSVPAGSEPISAEQTGLVWWVPAAAAGMIFLVAVFGMSIGALFRNRPIRGSCGGLAAMSGGDGSTCQICDGPPSDCPETEQAARGSEQGEVRA